MRIECPVCESRAERRRDVAVLDSSLPYRCTECGYEFSVGLLAEPTEDD